MRAFLTADLGNSALKLVVWERGGDRGARLLLAWRTPAVAGVGEELREWLRSAPALEGVALSAVAAGELESEVRGALARRFGEQAFRATLAGIENACREPERVGADRLFAARGAHELLGAPAVVVDAGTALTVDALGQREGRPLFLGGAIAPGPRAMAESLARSGARLFLVEADPRAEPLGRDTREALRAGVSLGFVGAAMHLVECVGRAAGLADAPVVLTGGARSLLERPGTFGRRPVRVRPELVHEGLLAAGTELELGERWTPALAAAE